MREVFGSVENRPDSLETARGRRRQLMEKAAGSPWKWALMAVVALESQGCESGLRQFGRVARYAALEPNAGSMDYDVGYRGQNPQQNILPPSERESATVEGGRALNRDQVGPGGGLLSSGFTGPRAYLEFGPPGVHPSIINLPEGFNGSNPDAIFAVARGTPRDPLRSLATRRSSDSARLEDALRQGVRPGELVVKRENVALRSLDLLLPNLPDQTWGVRFEWQEARVFDQDRGQNTTVACRTSPWSAPAFERTSRRVPAGHRLEHQVLSDDRTAWESLNQGEIYFSSEKSETHPERMAQAALATDAIRIDRWRQSLAELIQDREELAALPRTRENATAIRGLQSTIKELEASLKAAHARAKLAAMGKALHRLAPLIQNNEARFYVRFDDQDGSLRVIAIIDDADASKI